MIASVYTLLVEELAASPATRDALDVVRDAVRSDLRVVLSAAIAGDPVEVAADMLGYPSATVDAIVAEWADAMAPAIARRRRELCG